MSALKNLLPVILFSLVLAATLSGQAGRRTEDLDLLGALKSSNIQNIVTKGASVALDPKHKSFTVTFHYTRGECEARIPVSRMGWPTDWSLYKAVQVTFHTTSLETIAIGFSNGEATKFFFMEPLQAVRIQGIIPFDAFTQTRTMTPLRPLGYKVWPQRLFTFEKVSEIVFQMRYPNQPSQLTLYTFALTRDPPSDDILDRRPLIDAYGQWIPENWPEKAHSDTQLQEFWRQDLLEPASYPFCALGGDASRSVRSTGFFRIDKMEGKWILVDPHGHPFFSAGMDLVGYDPSSFATDISGREYLFEKLPAAGPAWLSPGRIVSYYVANVMKRFGEGWQEKWADHIVGRLKNWGFNTIGNWSNPNLAIRSKMPYVLPLQGWTTKKEFPFPYDFPDVFSAEFENKVDAAAREQVTPLKDDSNLIGWFLGNEPHWARKFGALRSWADMVLSDPEPSATKKELERLLDLNPDRKEEIKSDFLYTCAQEYFETITRAVRKYDPNHLVLGIRFAERPNDRWTKMSEIFDVFSINIYSPQFAPDPEMIHNYARISGKPVLIGEFTAATPGRGMQGLFYYVHKVRDHDERGKAYRYYVENSAASPDIIGAHWFQMVDDLPTGRPSDEERLNYGFVNVIDLPYSELVEAAKKTHRRIYDLKFGKVKPFQEVPNYN